MTGTPATVTVRPDSRIILHDLAMRPDRAEWIVGRFETRRFVALPREGVTALELLRAGHTVEQTAERLTDLAGRDFDVLGFVEALLALDFVAEVDGAQALGPAPAPASFPALRPEQVRFALSPVLPVLFGCLMAAAAAALAARPELLPSFRDLLWSADGGVVLAFGVAVSWLLVFVHELAHFAVARATGVHARIGLGTRLQFLVAETDISGIELAPRRHRLTAYLAGMATNLSVAAVAILLAAATNETETPHRILAALTLIALMPLAFQFMVFMRTDIYFVLQDLTGCRDLYGDGSAYARYLGNRLGQCVFRRPRTLADPSADLPRHERRAVRVYSVLLVVGTVLCLTVLVAISLPAELTLIYRAITRLGPDEPVTTNLDSIAVLLILGTLHAVWAVTWWRRRRGKQS
ncbi:site-2 protease family protein [Nocardia cyriacigeorgica]|uniref:site-2 protease family protein n=1 Tax=Nocardia cyriacigeorgica TaxID=135487 RepID=UPI001893AB1F|nr:site-2 protease family protein [Nocardia cyriacigeorgica]MBF6098748.1 site-2 protease family protein [Nocardia cyriacigeorgica]